MGLGMVAVVPADHADTAVQAVAEHGGVVVGEIVVRAEPDRSVEFIQ
jgi:phosphoribosylaminoimidazole (AIR) synthetase